MSFTQYKDVFAFHDAFFPAHGSTPLVKLEGYEAEGVEVYVKNESVRYGLPAFKILGASWGTAKALADRIKVDVMDFERLTARAKEEGIAVHAATDGNHGRAVAHTAAKLGMRSYIYVPKSVEQWSIDAIASEGAIVEQMAVDYDQTVLYAASQAEKGNNLLVQDTAWEGYEDIPSDIVHGYTRIFAEVEEQLPSGVSPTHVVVPVGVGSLAHAAVLAYKSLPTKVASVEPTEAACLQKSLREGKVVPIVTGETIMPGLNCGTVSSSAWPDLQAKVPPEDAVTVTDDETRAAMDDLAKWGVKAGPCGAAPFAALKHLVLPPGSVVILVVTEGQQ